MTKKAFFVLLTLFLLPAHAAQEGSSQPSEGGFATHKSEITNFFKNFLKPMLKDVSYALVALHDEFIYPTFKNAKAAAPDFFENTVKPTAQGVVEGIVFLYKEGVVPAIHIGNKMAQDAVAFTKTYFKEKGSNQSNKTSIEDPKAVDALRLSCLVACSTLLAASGAKLLYDGVTEYDGEIESKPTAKIALGSTFFALALGIVYSGIYSGQA